MDLPQLLALCTLLLPLAQQQERARSSEGEPRVERLESPARRPSRLPRFTRAMDGTTLLGWVEEREGGKDGAQASLCFATLVGERWSPAQTVARGERWFLNWADFPSLAALDGRRMLAHYLERSGSGPHDYRVRILGTSDGGSSWSAPRSLHEHDGPGEHGFVSLVPLGERGFGAVWLDGRGALAGATHGAHGGHGSMALYARTIGLDAALGPELVVDERVCDCCPTSALALDGGALLVAYRDRSEDELRDIAIARVADGASERVWESGDGWRIAGCPVNGPVLCASGQRVAVVWFTVGSQSVTRVHWALSPDGGRSFDAPGELGRGTALGRVDALFDEAGRLWILWLDDGPKESAWRLARIDPQGELLGEQALAPASPGRESGHARLASVPGAILVALTVGEESPALELVCVRWEGAPAASAGDLPR